MVVWRDSIKLIQEPPLPQLLATRAQPPSLSRWLEDRHPFQSLSSVASALQHSLLRAQVPMAKAMGTQISMSTPHFVQPPPIEPQYSWAGWSSGSGKERWAVTWEVPDHLVWNSDVPWLLRFKEQVMQRAQPCLAWSWPPSQTLGNAV